MDLNTLNLVFNKISRKWPNNKNNKNRHQSKEILWSTQTQRRLTKSSKSIDVHTPTGSSTPKGCATTATARLAGPS